MLKGRIETVFEIVSLDNAGCYYDLIGERDNIETAIADIDNYKLENPEYIYMVYKVIRKPVYFSQ